MNIETLGLIENGEKLTTYSISRAFEEDAPLVLTFQLDHAKLNHPGKIAIGAHDQRQPSLFTDRMLLAHGAHSSPLPPSCPTRAGAGGVGPLRHSPGRRCAGGGGTGEAAAAAAQWGRKARRRRRDSERGVRRVGAVNGLDRGHGHMNKGAGAQRTFRLALRTGRQRGLPPCPAT